jgi:Flp pilus assembly protein TadB
MADDDPNLDLPELDDEDSGFPWVTLILIAAAFLLIGAWMYFGKSYRAGGETARVALEQQLKADKEALEDEKQKVFDITQQLEDLKQKVAAGAAEDKAAAVAQYNQLAKQQNQQREKVKQLATEYNEKVEKLETFR